MAESVWHGSVCNTRVVSILSLSQIAFGLTEVNLMYHHMFSRSIFSRHLTSCNFGRIINLDLVHRCALSNVITNALDHRVQIGCSIV